MTTHTEHYNLTLPAEDDCYDVEVFNENFETVDTLMAETESGIHEVNDKIGTPADANKETIFSKLNKITSAVAAENSFIKSIQRVTVSMKTNENATLTIDAINTSHCIVLLEHLANPDTDFSVSYTLNSTSIYVETKSSYSKSIGFGFWIIEFN